MSIAPHIALTIQTPDTVAECWDGIFAVPGLYEALWALTNDYDNAHRANIEDMGPADVVGLNSVASFWDRFSDEHKAALNAAAIAFDAWWDAL